MGTRCSSHRPGGSLGPFPAATRAARFARQALPQGIWRGGLSSLGARGDPDTASQGAGRWLNRWPARHPARYSSHASHALSTVRDHTGAFIPEPSKEQLAVAEVLLSGDNVKVDAVAGSGKTTTLLHIARQVQDKTILLLTYNARLRHDCKDKKESCGLSNLEVHTYHSMGYKFYSSLCKNDAGLKEVVRKDVKVKRSFAYDMVIIDEAQDMSGLYCEFLHKLLHDNCNEEALLAIVGDNRQCIYEFMGADERHLTLAHKGVFATQRKWQELSLRTSYRVTGNMAAFINDVALGFKRLKAHKPPGEPVVYFRGSPFSAARELGYMLQSDIRNGKFDASDIFVLAPSMKQGTGSSSTPINILENDLVEAGIPCFAVTSDDEALDPDTIREKVVFSSIHQSKGLERKVVVCFGFDESYFRFFAKKLNPLVCPNTWYVALTRATERLYLVGEKHPNHHIPFLRIEQLKELEGRKDPAVKVVQLRGYESWKDPPQFQQDIRSRTSVTDLTRHLIDSQIEKAFTCLNAVQIATATESVEIPDTVPGINGLVESVADVNGVALPAMYEQMNNCSGSDATIMRELQEPWGSTVAAMDLHTGAQALIREVKELRLTTEEMAAKFLELSAIYQAMYLSGFAGMPTQVKCWDYVPKTSVEACYSMLDTHLGGKDVDYEVKMNLRYNDGVYKVDIDGRIDALTKMELWELKCVKALAKEHFLQTAVYAWMWMHSTEGRLARGSRSFRLLNFRTGEMWAIKDEYGIETAVAVIIEAKYSEKPVMSDKSFLAMCHSFHRVQAKRDLNSSQKAFLPRSPSQKGTGSRPFKCFACEPTRSFGTKQALLEHNMKVHG